MLESLKPELSPSAYPKFESDLRELFGKYGPDNDKSTFKSAFTAGLESDAVAYMLKGNTVGIPTFWYPDGEPRGAPSFSFLWHR